MFCSPFWKSRTKLAETFWFMGAFGLKIYWFTLWNFFPKSLMEKVKIPLPTRDIDAYFYSAGASKAPGVIFLHDLMGILPTTREVAEALQREGYHVLLPDLFSSMGVLRYCLRTFFDRLALINEDGVVGLSEVQAIIAFFQNMPYVDGERLGFVGQCLTGGYALHAALYPGIRAPVVFHHSLGIEGSGFPDHCAARLKTKVQGHFSNFDFLCPPSRVRALQEQLQERLEIHHYDLPHAIPHLFRITQEGQRAWQNMLRFFKENLQKN